MGKIAEVFAENLKRIRKEKNLTQAQLAEAVDLSLASIQNYESQRIWPSIETVLSLAEALDVSDVELFRDPEHRDPPHESIIEFARLISTADPGIVKQVLQTLEAGQPVSRPVSGKRIARPGGASKA